MGQRLNITITKNGKRLANAYYHWSAFTYESASITKEIIDFIREPRLISEHVKKSVDYIKAPKLISDQEKLEDTNLEDFSELAKNIIKLDINSLENFVDYPDLTALEKAIFLLNYTGAGFSQEEKKNIIKEMHNGTIPQIRGFLLKPTDGRNAGLTSITEEGMNETETWEEGRVTIDIGTNRVNFDNFRDLEDRDLEDYDEEELAKFNVIPRIQCSFNFDNMTFDEFDWFYEKVMFHNPDPLSDACDGVDYIYIDQSGNQYECIY